MSMQSRTVTVHLLIMHLIQVIAWYHRQFVATGDEMFKEEFPSDKYECPDMKDVNAKSLCNLLREKMVEYFTGTLSNSTLSFM